MIDVDWRLIKSIKWKIKERNWKWESKKATFKGQMMKVLEQEWHKEGRACSNADSITMN